MSRRTAIALTGVVLGLAACHSHIEDVPLASQNIYFSDKFYDVKATGPERAIIIGYGGKILETTDGGLTFSRIETGTDLALFKIFGRGKRMWVSGQEGLILHSEDEGKTWQKQTSGTQDYLFSIFFRDDDHGYAVGDKSVLVETQDGGKQWKVRKIKRSFDESNPDLALAMQDPIFYDVRFTDPQNGWIVGEFGRLLKTTDGGQNWSEHQETLMTPETGIVDPMDIPTFFGAHLVSTQEGFAAGLDGKIARTTDGGNVWNFEPMKLDFPIVDPLYQPFVTVDGTAWAVGAAGEVVTRAPGEAEWKRADLGMQIYTWMRAIDFADAQNGWIVGGYGTILRTSDGGKTWRLCLG